MSAQTSNSVVNRPPRSIPVRRPTFDFDSVKSSHWFGGDAFQSHLMHALSLTFPEGERFFMDSVRHYMGRIDAPALRHEISRFLAQEAMHGQAHDAFNDWVKSFGFDTAPIEARINANLARARRELPHLHQLAVTCALEHFTAILAELIFANDELAAQMEPEMRRLWMWHAVEETEHKAVAFDTYLAVGGEYRMRAMVMLFTTMSFVFNVARFQARLLRSDPAARTAPALVRGWFRMWVMPGIFLPVIPAWLDYFRPDFHPWQRKPRGDFDSIRDAMEAPLPKGAA